MVNSRKEGLLSHCSQDLTFRCLSHHNSKNFVYHAFVHKPQLTLNCKVYDHIRELSFAFTDHLKFTTI